MPVSRVSKYIKGSTHLAINKILTFDEGPLELFIYLFIYITLPMNKQHITFTNIDNWQGTRYSLCQLQRPSI